MRNVDWWRRMWMWKGFVNRRRWGNLVSRRRRRKIVFVVWRSELNWRRRRRRMLVN